MPGRNSKELDEDGVETGKYVPTPQVETVKFKEIIRLRNIGLVESVYSSTDLDNVKPGSFIILKGYPFDGLPAEVIEIKKRSQKLKIKLLLDTFSNNITVDFANVFYTVYREFNAPITYDDRSIEGLLERSKFSIDKLTFENERPTE